MLLDLSRRGDFSWGLNQQQQPSASSSSSMNMVEAVAQEFGRMLKQYEGDLATLLDDFASRYISSGACMTVYLAWVFVCHTPKMDTDLHTLFPLPQH